MNIFTYITGIATLIGLFLQLKNVFPKYKELRKKITLVALGLFIGTLLGGIRIVQFNLSFGRSPDEFLKFLCVCVGIIILLILILSSVFVKDSGRRDELFLFTLFAMFIIPVAIGCIFLLNNPKDLNLDELKYIVDYHEKNKNYDRAIQILEIMKSKVDPNDLRLELIDKKISSIKVEQIKGSNQN